MLFPKKPKDKREKNAMKAKLRRLCEDKAKAGGSPKYQVPKWLHDEWKSRDHLEMALEFKECGFDKDVNIGIHPEKKNSVSIMYGKMDLFRATVAPVLVAIDPW